jgi:hypothetical protein
MAGTVEHQRFEERIIEIGSVAVGVDDAEFAFFRSDSPDREVVGGVVDLGIDVALLARQPSPQRLNTCREHADQFLANVIAAEAQARPGKIDEFSQAGGEEAEDEGEPGDLNASPRWRITIVNEI